MTKAWWRSKTLWFNAIVAALAAAEYAGGYLRGLLPGDVFGWGMAVLAIGNAVLRVLTFQPVGWHRGRWPGGGYDAGGAYRGEQWDEQWSD